MHRFGVLVPSTNTSVETEYGRLLPTTLQVHVARIPLLSSGVETTARTGDSDVDYQARLLGSAEVEVVAVAQTAQALRIMTRASQNG
jgi:maleate isomerase